MARHIHIYLRDDRQKQTWFKSHVEYLNADYSSHWLSNVMKLGVETEEQFREEVRRRLKLIGATRIKFGPITKSFD